MGCITNVADFGSDFFTLTFSFNSNIHLVHFKIQLKRLVCVDLGHCIAPLKKISFVSKDSSWNLYVSNPPCFSWKVNCNLSHTIFRTSEKETKPENLRWDNLYLRCLLNEHRSLSDHLFSSIVFIKILIFFFENFKIAFPVLSIIALTSFRSFTFKSSKHIIQAQLPWTF